MEQALGDLKLEPSQTHVFEYGCGTGPATCFLAASGFAVDAIDVIPRAIRLARRFARDRGLTIDFQVQDICDLATVPPSKLYDLVVDSFCLQSVVLDEDRAKLFAAVRSRLKPDGYYLISTAMSESGRDYGGGIYDEATGIVYSQLGGESSSLRDVDGAVLIGTTWYVPHRRHLKAEALAQELAPAGFSVLFQGGESGGDVICQ